MENIGLAERRALKIIAATACTDRVLVARGYPLEVLARLVRLGLADVAVERVGSGKTADIVCHLKATDAGMRALASRRGLPAIQPIAA